MTKVGYWVIARLSDVQIPRDGFGDRTCIACQQDGSHARALQRMDGVACFRPDDISDPDRSEKQPTARHDNFRRAARHQHPV